jgi:hypothetical protein
MLDCCCVEAEKEEDEHAMNWDLSVLGSLCGYYVPCPTWTKFTLPKSNFMLEAYCDIVRRAVALA